MKPKVWARLLSHFVVCKIHLKRLAATKYFIAYSYAQTLPAPLPQQSVKMFNNVIYTRWKHLKLDTHFHNRLVTPPERPFCCLLALLELFQGSELSQHTWKKNQTHFKLLNLRIYT